MIKSAEYLYGGWLVEFVVEGWIVELDIEDPDMDLSPNSQEFAHLCSHLCERFLQERAEAATEALWERSLR